MITKHHILTIDIKKKGESQKYIPPQANPSKCRSSHSSPLTMSFKVLTELIHHQKRLTYGVSLFYYILTSNMVSSLNHKQEGELAQSQLFFGCCRMPPCSFDRSPHKFSDNLIKKQYKSYLLTCSIAHGIIHFKVGDSENKAHTRNVDVSIYAIVTTKLVTP